MDKLLFTQWQVDIIGKERLDSMLGADKWLVMQPYREPVELPTPAGYVPSARLAWLRMCPFAPASG